MSKLIYRMMDDGEVRIRTLEGEGVPSGWTLVWEKPTINERNSTLVCLYLQLENTIGKYLDRAVLAQPMMQEECAAYSRAAATASMLLHSRIEEVDRFIGEVANQRLMHGEMPISDYDEGSMWDAWDYMINKARGLR